MSHFVRILPLNLSISFWESRMRHTKLISVFTFLSAGIVAFSTSANQADTAQETLTNTRQNQLIHMLKQDCGSCHGMTLKGGLGPALLPKNLKGKPTLFLENTIFYGRPGTAMPPWQGILTKEEVTWLTQQLQQGIEND